jgi:putative addiction module component (TIGR02574 family)
MNTRPEFDALFKLPVAERLQLVEDLWDSIAADREQEPVPEPVLAELRERKARYDANPASGVSWDDAKRRLREG